MRCAQGCIFGAFVAESWKLDKHYFGNGETFLFRMQPGFEKCALARGVRPPAGHSRLRLARA